MNKKYPRLRRNLNTGDCCLEFVDANKRLHTVDMATPVFLHEMQDGVYIQFAGGTIQTGHTYEELVDFVYPLVDEDDV